MDEFPPGDNPSDVWVYTQSKSDPYEFQSAVIKESGNVIGLRQSEDGLERRDGQIFTDVTVVPAKEIVHTESRLSHTEPYTDERDWRGPERNFVKQFAESGDLVAYGSVSTDDDWIV